MFEYIHFYILYTELYMRSTPWCTHAVDTMVYTCGGHHGVHMRWTLLYTCDRHWCIHAMDTGVHMQWTLVYTCDVHVSMHIRVCILYTQMQHKVNVFTS